MTLHLLLAMASLSYGSPTNTNTYGDRLSTDPDDVPISRSMLHCSNDRSKNLGPTRSTRETGGQIARSLCGFRGRVIQYFYPIEIILERIKKKNRKICEKYDSYTNKHTICI